MEKAKIQEKILQWQLLADQFFKEDANVFIKEFNGNIHFCKIVEVGETRILIDNYAPDQRAGKRDNLDWLNIEDFDRVRDKEEGK